MKCIKFTYSHSFSYHFLVAFFSFATVTLFGCPAPGKRTSTPMEVIAKEPIEFNVVQGGQIEGLDADTLSGVGGALTENAEKPSKGKLAPFFAKLAALREAKQQKNSSKPLHILQIGDSHVASDTMGGELRRLFQGKFGVGGRGYIAAGIPWSTYRQEDVDYKMSPDWWTQTGRRNDNRQIFGIGGTRIISEKEGAFVERTEHAPFVAATITFLKTRQTGSFDVYINNTKKPLLTVDTTLTSSEIADLYVKEDPEVLKQYIRSEDDGSLTLKPIYEQRIIQLKAAREREMANPKAKPKQPIIDESIYELGVISIDNLPKNASTLRIVASSSKPIVLFGTLLTSSTDTNGDPGVVVSSIGLNGARSATYLGFDTRVSRKELLDVINPDLVIVTLGTNEAYNLRDETLLDNNLLTREANNNKTFLDIVSANGTRPLIMMTPMEFAMKPLDRRCYERKRVRRGRRRRWIEYLKKDVDLEKHPECRWITPPSFFFIRDIIAKNAAQHQFALWDSYEAMGGSGSNREWANNTPVLANSDGVHLSLRGYQTLSTLFFNDLMEAYHKWESGGPALLLTTKPNNEEDESSTEASNRALNNAQIESFNTTIKTTENLNK